MKAKPNRQNSEAWQGFIEKVRQSDLTRVAEAIGVSVQRSAEKRGKALCPFHDDHRPSLHFFVGAEDGAGLFKCHVCGSGGDAFRLMMLSRKLDFMGAARELATLLNLEVPGRKAYGLPERFGRQDGLSAALSIFSSQSDDEKVDLENWARNRGFTLDLLTRFRIVYSTESKLLRASAGDRILRERLRAADLISQRTMRADRLQQELLMDVDETSVKDAFSNDRVIFPIFDFNGRIEAFVGRINELKDNKTAPRYLFTRGFQKRNILYGLNVVYEDLNTPKNLKQPKRSAALGREFHLYIVEGIPDVLRLASIGINAVALLGTSLSNQQLVLLENLSNELAERERPLCVHLFLDADAPGRHATNKVLSKLVPHAARVLYQFDVVTPETVTGNNKDPDELLAGLAVADAQNQLKKWSYSAARTLFATAIGCTNFEVDDEWQRIAAPRQQFILRTVREALDPWRAEGDVAVLFRASFQPDSDEQTDWAKRLLNVLTPHRSQTQAPAKDNFQSTAPVPIAVLLRAMELARASTQRREVPVDDGSWERIFRAYRVSAEFLRERLQLWDPNEGSGIDEMSPAGWQIGRSGFLEPLLACKIPKNSGGWRLKAMPCPEDLALEQYLLNELLCDRGDSAPWISRLIPAVRYSAGRGLWSTGGFRYANRDNADPNGSNVSLFRAPVCSFAYQINMDVVNGDIRDAADGIFRPYFDCWTDFTKAIDAAVTAAVQTESNDTSEGTGLFHIARLDIKKFYDNLPRGAVQRVLKPAIKEALEGCVAAGMGVNVMAPAFAARNHLGPEERANALVDILCDLSFGYTYNCPDTGKPQTTARLDRGVPQGPDLSAYLANIALFPLDEAISNGLTTQGKRRNLVAYCRYVDDMVVVTRSRDELNRVQQAIVFELEKLGLELSPKSEPLPAMTVNEIRAWVHTARGGLAVSGLPETTGRDVFDFLPALADDHGVDRREALLRLRDPELLHPDTSLADLCEAARKCLVCADLRYGDLQRVISLIWLCVAQDVVATDTVDAVRIAEKFWQFSSRSGATSHLTGPGGLQLILGGLDKFLRSRKFLSPALTAKSRADMSALRNRLAGCISVPLFDELTRQTALSQSSAENSLRFSLAIQL
ncbi:MAG: toprim domain-containing protein, partial [Planctomycetes bacterium]|nr:toprim domain-containing protein [Planctomycetota bacterium]